MFFPASGHQIYYQEYGAGDCVVFLHHGLGSVKSWQAQAPVLAEAGFRVILYDRWGYGKSTARPRFGMPYFEEDLEDLRLLLGHLGVSQASLVGHSDGGTIALYFAAQHGELVSRLVVVAAHIYIEPKMEMGIREIQRSYQESERFRRGLAHAHGEKATQVFQNWFEGWARPENLAWDMRPLLSGIACPVLVVQGVEDEHASLQHARDLANALPDAELWLLPSAGHMLPQENAEMFNAKLIAFLNQNGSL